MATLAARGAPPEDIFAAAVNEVAGLLPVAGATMGRFEPDDTVTTVASWSATGVAYSPGRRWPTEGRNIPWMVFQTRRAARIDDFSDATDPIGATAREAGYTSAVGTPIVVEGDLFGDQPRIRRVFVDGRPVNIDVPAQQAPAGGRRGGH